LPRLNDENSRAKFQNGREKSAVANSSAPIEIVIVFFTGVL
jgi:hypothetical protein